MVTFAPPRVTQFRNAHNYLADMDAEADLYVNRLFIYMLIGLFLT